jgi:hypothetical protein
MTIVIYGNKEEIDNIQKMEEGILRNIRKIFEERKISDAWRISILNGLVLRLKKDFSNKILDDFKNTGKTL